MKALEKLKQELAIVADLNGAAAVLGWDQHTYMPKGSLEPRIRQMSTLGELSHERMSSPSMRSLLEEVEAARDSLSTSDQALLRVVRRDVDKATRLPAELVRRRAELTGHAMDCWMQAKPANDYKAFEPHLKKLVQLCRDEAEAYGYEDQPYDALLNLYEPGLPTRRLEQVFGELRDQLVPFCQQLFEKVNAVDDAFLYRDFPKQRQWDLGIEILKAMHYDFNRGRQDESAHPFTTGFGVSDIRVTTRIHEDDFRAGLFGTMHEGGHALYEQNVDSALDRTPLAEGTSLGIHESQSRLWENLVGRSRPFWEFWFPKVKELFPTQLDGIGFQAFHRGINRVKPSLIRIEADEVTYSLHIFIRFELELAMLSGELDTRDLPGAWREKCKAYLGIEPKADSEGCLQDMHWADGTFGYFPTYALGNLYGVQIFNTARLALPALDEQLASGEMKPLKDWLSHKVYRHGRCLDPGELMQEVTGAGLSVKPFMDYIRTKYSDIYELD